MPRPTPPYCCLIGLECGLGFVIFKSSPGDSNVQVGLGTGKIRIQHRATTITVNLMNQHNRKDVSG